jgi:transposase InsO family protein
MPPLPDATPIFNCKFCDMAKQRKSNRELPVSSENYKPGTAYHMDLGFIRGPDNLPDMVANGATKGKHITEGRRGETCYLLFVDVATRHIWTFLLKNKNPPTTLIDSFLQKNGISRKRNKITTSPDGMLARSNRFQQTCETNGFEIDTHDAEIDFEYIRGDVPLAIRTDNGGEFVTEELREVADRHGYIMETTSPDKSSQNGLAERPHRTLKERVRCLLHTAGLGVEFWPGSLIHATWLYNRTYHSAIDVTPHQAFTRRRPTLDKNLLAFGCTVTPKMARDRTSALDPNSHHGILLGYLPNNDIRYWDIHTQSEKTAGHEEYDELQCGDDPAQRSPASKHLLQVMTGADHNKRRTDVMHEKGIEVATKPNSVLTDTTQLVLDSAPPSYTACAAKFERPSETEIFRQLQQLEMSLSIFDRSMKERISLRGNHPTLGIRVEPHEDLKRAVVVTQMQSGTSAAKIPRWRSRYRNSIIQEVDGEQITTPQDLTLKIRKA